MTKSKRKRKKNSHESLVLYVDRMQVQMCETVDKAYADVSNLPLHLRAFLTPLLYLSPAARSRSRPALMTPVISTFAPKTMYRMLGPRMWTKSKCCSFSTTTPDPFLVGKTCARWCLFDCAVVAREKTRFIYASASRKRPRNVLPCFVSTIKSIPAKCRSNGARLASADDGFAFFGSIVLVVDTSAADVDREDIPR